MAIGSLLAITLGCGWAIPSLWRIDGVAVADSAPDQTDPTAAPAAVTGRILNVRDFGAQGTGKVNDRDALQRAANAAQPGDTIYFPAGIYLDDDGMHVGKSNITMLGDGPASVIKFNYRPGFWLQGNGITLTGVVVKRLKFEGLKGLYKRDGNTAYAIKINEARGTVISDCDFEGPGYAVYNDNQSQGTRIENCRVNGWGTVAIYCSGGEQILNCSLVQNDPRLEGQFSSHGLYIHSGAKDILVRDTLIENARYYGAQIYGNVRGTVTSNIRFERVTFKGCYSGLTIQNGEVDAAMAEDVVIKDCSFLGTYGSPAIGIKQGDGIQVVNNLIDGTPGVGLQLGAWGQYEPNYSINNLVAATNVIRNCNIGIWAQASWGGTFNNVRLLENTITRCRVPIDIEEAAGVLLSP